MSINMRLQEKAPSFTLGRYNVIEYARDYLWRDLAVWSRAYLTSLVGDPGFQSAVFLKLYSIPLNFGQLFSIVFGQHAGEQYIDLLSKHIVILQSIISGMAKGDQNAVNENTAELYKNADARAAFLGQLNPYWEESVWRSYLYYYLALTLQEIATFFAKDYDANIKIFDRIMYHTTQMGDYFSDGMLKYLIESGIEV